MYFQAKWRKEIETRGEGKEKEVCSVWKKKCQNENIAFEQTKRGFCVSLTLCPDLQRGAFSGRCARSPQCVDFLSISGKLAPLRLEQFHSWSISIVGCVHQQVHCDFVCVADFNSMRVVGVPVDLSKGVVRFLADSKSPPPSKKGLSTQDLPESDLEEIVRIGNDSTLRTRSRHLRAALSPASSTSS